MPAASDRDLLLGVLADEMGAVDRPQLMTVMNAWAGQRGKSLGDVLVENGQLGEEQRAWLQRAVDKQIARHGDARTSIRSLSAEAVADAWIQAGANPALAAGLSTLVPLSGGLSPGDGLGLPTSMETRYEILRHHASGGLGEVFLARDGELHREVALKQIQARCADDQDLRARFTLEAEITGGLEHPNIVPVHGLGKDAEGRPFYVMRFIRGENLLDAITRFHSLPSALKPPGERTLMLRKLLGCFVDVCNAVAYAHSRGVIHRDLKPENVMLGPYGETLLVDWGLAKLVQREQQAVAAAGEEAATPPPRSTLHPAAAGSPTPTRIGSVVGTLAYMSPEQAAGLVDQLGPASDVYGLGAILYTILTGHAPFGGSQSEQVRQQIIMAKFSPPRQANPRVSPALEAICLKAMAVDSSRRYATARELAEDVEAWLADEPVHAWREPWHTRTGRWMRRHRALAGAGMAAILVAAVSLSIGVVLLTAANERERAAKALAVLREEESRQNFQMARDAVDKYLTRVSEDPRLKAHDLERLRRDLLETARSFYEQFIQQESDEPDLRSASAWAHFRLASITAEIGSKQRALELLQQAVDTFSGLAEQYPDEKEYCFGELRAQLDLARLYATISRPSEATATLSSARSLAERLLDRDPKDANSRAAMASAHSIAAGLCLERKEFSRAEAEYRAAVAIRGKLVAECPSAAEQQSLLARDETGLGLLCRRQGRREEAQKLLVSAADRNSALVGSHSDVPEYVMDLATACDNLAMLYADAAGTAKEIETAYQRALAVRNQLLRSHPGVAQYQAGVARGHFNLAVLYCRTGQFQKGETSYLAARQMYEQLAEEHSDVPDYVNERGAVMNNLGLLYRTLGKPEEALSALRKAIDIRRGLTRKHPANRLYLHHLGSSCVNLGDALNLMHRAEETDTAYREAIAACEKLAAKWPKDMDCVVDLGSVYVKAGTFVQEQGKAQAALDLFEKAVKLVQSRSSFEQQLPGAKFILTSASGGRAEALSRLGRHDEAKAAWEKTFASGADQSQVVLRLARAEAHARAGDHAFAAAEAKDLSPLCEKQSLWLYRLATVWALAADAAGRDAKLDAAQRTTVAERCAAAAVAALVRCRDTGFFKDPFQVERLKTDPGLKSLKDREDFNRLVPAPTAAPSKVESSTPPSKRAGSP